MSSLSLDLGGGAFLGGEDPISAEAHARQIKQLLPPGILWNLLPDSQLSKLTLALGDEFARVDARASMLLEEADPRTANEMIGDWETMLGLPDDRVTSISLAIEARRVAVTQKYVARGGQSRQYFIDLALSCGYAATVTEFPVLRTGFRVMDRANGDVYAYAFLLNCTVATGGALSHADFERVIRHAAHAHVQVGFVYA